MLGLGPFNFHTVNSFVRERNLFSCENLYSKSCNYTHPGIDPSDLWPSQPSTLTSVHWPPPTLSLWGVFALIRSFLIIVIFFKDDFFFFFLFFLDPFPGQQWLSRAELEWRVRSKTVNGAGSLWGNKRQHQSHCLLFLPVNRSFVLVVFLLRFGLYVVKLNWELQTGLTVLGGFCCFFLSTQNCPNVWGKICIWW